MSAKESDNHQTPQMLGDILIGPKELEDWFEEVQRLPLEERVRAYVERAKLNQQKCKEVFYKIESKTQSSKD